MENEKIIKNEMAKCEKDMIVYFTSHYNEKIEDNKIIINDNFEVLEKIGEGSYWKVIKVKRKLLSSKGEVIENNYYVFKKGVLNKKIINFNEKDKECRIGVKEYKILKEICHPNIARLYECIIDNTLNKIILVMEYCDLGALMISKKKENTEYYEYNNKVMKYLWKKYEGEKKIPENFSYEYNEQKEFFEKASYEMLIQLVSALKYLKNKLIAHLDIKPENILIKTVENEDNDNFMKLSDFSISKKIPSENSKIEFYGGTPIYNPPEIENEEEIDPFKYDIYTLGATIFTFLFNKFNFSEIKNLQNVISNQKLYKILYITLEPDFSIRASINQIEEIILN